MSFTETDDDGRGGQVQKQPEDGGEFAQVEFSAGLDEQVVTGHVAEPDNQQGWTIPADPDGDADRRK